MAGACAAEAATRKPLGVSVATFDKWENSANEQAHIIPTGTLDLFSGYRSAANPDIPVPPKKLIDKSALLAVDNYTARRFDDQ